jgi:hypothetical protein
LEVAGRDATRLISVRRHAEVLAGAIPFMTDEQTTVARSRIERLETKWGSLLPRDPKDPKTGGIPPETVVRQWLSKRRSSERLLRVVSDAAVCVANGETRLLDVMDYAYRAETDRFIHLVRYDSFKEWLIQLRIARFEPGGRLQPADLCKWWVNNMAPADHTNPAYAACLRRLE